LSDVKTQDIIKDFQILHAHKEESTFETPRDVASRYILKLIPFERRIIMPTLREERNNIKLKLINGLTDHNMEKIIIDDDSKTFEELIFHNLYENTGLYFISESEEYHLFLPHSLREFLSLCKLLASFIREPSENRRIDNFGIKMENLELFENYFLYTWTKHYLMIPFRKMILESSSTSYKEWNKFFITSIVEILSKEGKYKQDWIEIHENILKGEEELLAITDRKNFAANVSLGDFIYFCSFLNRVYTNDIEIKKLIFSLNCWYSIIINKIYFKAEIDSLSSYNSLRNTPETRKVNYPGIYDLVNGTILNKHNKIIKDWKNQFRIQFKINVKALLKKIKDPQQKQFILNNIFIKDQHDEKTYRRVEDSIVRKEDLKETGNPTFNIFSFMHTNENNIFPVPFNNLELWHYILEKIDKDDPRVEDEDFSKRLVNLFIHIYYCLPEHDLKKDFLEHPLIKLLVNSTTIEKFEKNKSIETIPWINQITYSPHQNKNTKDTEATPEV